MIDECDTTECECGEEGVEHIEVDLLDVVSVVDAGVGVEPDDGQECCRGEAEYCECVQSVVCDDVVGEWVEFGCAECSDAVHGGDGVERAEQCECECERGECGG